MNTVLAISYFFIALATDRLTIAWYGAVHGGQPSRAAGLGLVLAVVGWVPLLLLVTTLNWQVVIADVLGGTLGSYWGVKVSQNQMEPRREEGL